MPELPEITALGDFLDEQLAGAQLTQVLLPSAFRPESSGCSP